MSESKTSTVPETILAIIGAGRCRFPEAVAIMVKGIAEDPERYRAVISHFDSTEEGRTMILRAIVAITEESMAAKAPEAVTAAKAPEESMAAKAPEAVTAPGKVLAWLQAHPGKHAPGEVRTALTMPSGTFGEAVKTCRDRGTVYAEGQGAGRRIWAE